MNSPAFKQHINALEQRYPSNHKLSLDNLKVLLNRLGNPHHRTPPIIHIAGTNGKGSTQAFLKSILTAGGYRIHAYTSPHLVNFTERIVLNGQQISEPLFLNHLDQALNVLGDSTISWFELITAIAFKVFAETPGNVVLLETGMGGRLDATNVIDQPACSIITSISFDHQHVLGNTLAQIATEKAGIIKPGVPIVTCRQAADAQQVIYDTAHQLGSPLYAQAIHWDCDTDDHSPQYPLKYQFDDQTKYYAAPGLKGQHQYENAGLALTALNVLQPILPLTSTAINQGLNQVKWSARLQDLHDHPWQKLLSPDTKLYLDGAHNSSGITTLADFISKSSHPTISRPVVIMGVLRRKNLIELMIPLQNCVAQVIGVPIDGEDAYSEQEIAAVAQQLGIKSSAAPSIPVALQTISRQQPCPALVIICGSLYLAGQVLTVKKL